MRNQPHPRTTGTRRARLLLGAALVSGSVAAAPPGTAPPPSPSAEQPAATTSRPPVTPPAPPAAAEAPWLGDATLARLEHESLAAVPELRRAASLVQAAKEKVPQAGAWPDPELQLGLQNDGFTSFEVGSMPTSFIWVMAGQTFPWPGKTALREGVATVGVSQAEQSQARVRLSTQATVRRAYLGLLLARGRLRLLDELDALWEKSLGAARIRYEAGDGAQSDLLQAQLERSRLKQRRLALKAEERTRVQALNRLRARPLDEALEAPADLRTLPEPATLTGRFVGTEALARSPELALARLTVSGSEKSVALAEKSYYPDLTVEAGLMVRGALPPMWLVTLGGPLPVFAGSKQSRRVAEAQAETAASGEDVATFEQLLLLRTAERAAVFEALNETLALYDQGLLIQSAATTESTLAQYSVGRVGFASVLEANAGFLADRDSYLGTLAAAYAVLIDQNELSLAPAAMPPAMGGASGGMPSAGSSPVGTSPGQPSQSGTDAFQEGPGPGGSMSSM